MGLQCDLIFACCSSAKAVVCVALRATEYGMSTERGPLGVGELSSGNFDCSFLIQKGGVLQLAKPSAEKIPEDCSLKILC
eukprot:XP_001693227.1 predicted protein [Chlamydomonas reinhardtii]